jgi:hypothetical protein
MPYGYHPISYQSLKIAVPSLYKSPSSSGSNNLTPQEKNTPNSRDKLKANQTPLAGKSVGNETAQTPILRPEPISSNLAPPLPLDGPPSPRAKGLDNCITPTTSRQNSKESQGSSSLLGLSNVSVGADLDYSDEEGLDSLCGDFTDEASSFVSTAFVEATDDSELDGRGYPLKEKEAIDLSPKICVNCRKNFYGKQVEYCSGECMHSYQFLKSAYLRLSGATSQVAGEGGEDEWA